ncbi:hypothetical protein SESBI_15813 [Sesbania bispinosa]|nr:hypothetical protein SESBI_15813 [Sesbania bispinosa]
MADEAGAKKGVGATSMEEVVRDRTTNSNPNSQNPASPARRKRPPKQKEKEKARKGGESKKGNRFSNLNANAEVGDFKDGSTGLVICPSSLSSGLATSASGHPKVEGNQFKFCDSVEMEDHVVIDHADKSNLSEVEIMDHEDGHGLKDLSHVDRGPIEVPMLLNEREFFYTLDIGFNGVYK